MRTQIIQIKFMIAFAMICTLLFAQTGNEIIERVDNNMVVKTVSYHARMRISLGSVVREKEFFGYTQGREFAYLEFSAPARDKRTRFLKIGKEMWLYLPSLEKATKIAGHMLRQSLMGSDFSYDDITENEKLHDLYDIEIIGKDTFSGENCFVLELTAKVSEVNYYKRKMWVDADNYIPLHVELYAKSGKLMKEISVSEFKKIEGHNFPTSIKMVNKLRKDTYTEMIMEDVELDTEIPAKVFTKSYLERK